MAQMARKEGYVAKPSSSGSRMEVNSRSSAVVLGGMPRALFFRFFRKFLSAHFFPKGSRGSERRQNVW